MKTIRVFFWLGAFLMIGVGWLAAPGHGIKVVVLATALFVLTIWQLGDSLICRLSKDTSQGRAMDMVERVGGFIFAVVLYSFLAVVMRIERLFGVGRNSRS